MATPFIKERYSPKGRNAFNSKFGTKAKMKNKLAASAKMNIKNQAACKAKIRNWHITHNEAIRRITSAG
jgi:hypothetical protein